MLLKSSSQDFYYFILCKQNLFWIVKAKKADFTAFMKLTESIVQLQHIIFKHALTLA